MKEQIAISEKHQNARVRDVQAKCETKCGIQVRVQFFSIFQFWGGG